MVKLIPAAIAILTPIDASFDPNDFNEIPVNFVMELNCFIVIVLDCTSFAASITDLSTSPNRFAISSISALSLIEPSSLICLINFSVSSLNALLVKISNIVDHPLPDL
jgi:hypothetical protein